LRFDRKTDEIVPDIIKVIYENDEEIKFEYLTNFYNQQGLVKTLKRGKYSLDNIPEKIFISNSLSTKHFAILKKDDALYVLNDILDKLDENRITKYSWFDVILDTEKIKGAWAYISYCYKSIAPGKIPNPIHDLCPVETTHIEELIKILK